MCRKNAHLIFLEKIKKLKKKIKLRPDEVITCIVENI